MEVEIVYGFYPNLNKNLIVFQRATDLVTMLPIPVSVVNIAVLINSIETGTKKHVTRIYIDELNKNLFCQSWQGK